MKVIKVSTSNSVPAEIFLRQTAESLGIWGDCQFIVNQSVNYCDWWFICHQSAIQSNEITICDPHHIVFISMEPTEGSTPHSFYKQFSKLLLCDRSVSHSNIYYTNATTWWAGIQVEFNEGHKYLPIILQDYDSFKKMKPQSKKNRISVICSNKNWFPGHNKRLRFLEKLRLHSISKHIDFYGSEYTPILDKLDAIAPYKYHLVLENSVVKDYWSEKIGDPLLGFALPIYYGCPNIEKYFSTEALIRIDIDDFEKTVETLEQILRCNLYETQLPAIIEARNMILERYNIFQIMANIADTPAKKLLHCSVKPSWYFKGPWLRRFIRNLIHHFRGIHSV